jgi:hypothetical protein
MVATFVAELSLEARNLVVSTMQLEDPSQGQAPAIRLPIFKKSPCAVASTEDPMVMAISASLQTWKKHALVKVDNLGVVAVNEQA